MNNTIKIMTGTLLTTASEEIGDYVSLADYLKLKREYDEVVKYVEKDNDGCSDVCSL
jgi:hypothetical protein